MDSQTPEQGWQELQAHIEEFFDQVLRVEKEKDLSCRIEAGMEAENGQPATPDPDRQSDEEPEDRTPNHLIFLVTGQTIPFSP